MVLLIYMLPMSSATMFVWMSVLLYVYFWLVMCDKIAVRMHCICVVHSVAHLLLAASGAAQHCRPLARLLRAASRVVQGFGVSLFFTIGFAFRCRALLDFKPVLAYSVAHGGCSAVGNHSQVAPPQGCCIMAQLLRATCGAGNMLTTSLHSVGRSFVWVE